MSKLTISNLDDARELDGTVRAEFKGGMALPVVGELPIYGMTNVLASINSASVSQNALNVVMSGAGGSGDSVNNIGSFSPTLVNLSPVTVVQGGLPTA